MIENVVDFIKTVESDLGEWPVDINPWFRGESGTKFPPLTPKVSQWTASQENHLLQSFRRKAGGLANTPPRESHTDLWLFLAQHYGIDTRLLDWTEGALIALYFAINRGDPSPRVYMLNPYKLNSLAFDLYNETHDIKYRIHSPNFPLTWPENNIGHENIALAWNLRNNNRGLELPIAVPGTYQDHRMIAQRSCFTIHGIRLDSLISILEDRSENLSEYLKVYKLRRANYKNITNQLSYLGVSQSTIFPDLDNLSRDINRQI